MDEDELFDLVSSEASLTYPIQASALRKNGFAMMKGHPCKIIDMCTSSPGKHGHAKVNNESDCYSWCCVWVDVQTMYASARGLGDLGLCYTKYIYIYIYIFAYNN